MALAVFNQFPQLTRLMAQLARVAAHKETAKCAEERSSEGRSPKAIAKRCASTRADRGLDLSTGRATLVDHAANLAALDGSASVFALPDLVPGEVRRFDLRLDVAAETAVTFEGCEDFELDAADIGAAVTKLEHGISVTLPTGAYLYIFTETKAGTILLTRHTLAPHRVTHAAASSRPPYHAGRSGIGPYRAACDTTRPIRAVPSACIHAGRRHAESIETLRVAKRPTF